MLKQLKAEFLELDISPKKLRTFGNFMGGVFGVIAIWIWWKEYPTLLLFMISICASFFVCIGYLAPHFLVPLYRVWMGLGITLGSIISPVVLGILFYCVLTPIGLLKRIFSARKKGDSETYWISHNQSQDPKRMENLF